MNICVVSKLLLFVYATEIRTAFVPAIRDKYVHAVDIWKMQEKALSMGKVRNETNSIGNAWLLSPINQSCQYYHCYM